MLRRMLIPGRVPTSMVSLFIASFVLFSECIAQSTEADVLQPSRIYDLTAPEKPDLKRWLKGNENLLNRGDVCGVSYSWTDETRKISTSNFLLQSFLVVPEDEEVKRIVRHKASGLDVRIGVQYHPLAFGSASEIRIALAFEGQRDDVFDETSRSEATTLRDHKWKFLETAKSIRAGERFYTFHLTCRNGKTAFSWLKRRK